MTSKAAKAARDSATIDEHDEDAPSQTGPRGRTGTPEVADGNRLYQVGEDQQVLVVAGHQVPPELVTVPWVPAVLVDGGYRPAEPRRGRRPSRAAMVRTKGPKV